MVKHVSWWIGEEKLIGPEYDGPDADPYKIQLRAVKRACVAGLMEQMVQTYANEEDCFCSGRPSVCDCFTRVNNHVPKRVSRLHLMAARLFYGSTTSNWLNKKCALRMRETRILWENTGDIVICRNAALLKQKTEDWGKIADEGLIHLGNLLQFDVVRTESEAQTNLFDDSDEESPVAHFGNLGINRAQNQTQQPGTSAYNVNDASIESEIQKFLMQQSNHFASCKCLLRSEAHILNDSNNSIFL